MTVERVCVCGEKEKRKKKRKRKKHDFEEMESFVKGTDRVISFRLSQVSLKGTRNPLSGI